MSQNHRYKTGIVAARRVSWIAFGVGVAGCLFEPEPTANPGPAADAYAGSDTPIEGRLSPVFDTTIGEEPDSTSVAVTMPDDAIVDSVDATTDGSAGVGVAMGGEQLGDGQPGDTRGADTTAPDAILTTATSVDATTDGTDDPSTSVDATATLDDARSASDVTPAEASDAAATCNVTTISPTAASTNLDGLHPSCTTTSCTATGSLAMSFCCDGNGAWSQCAFSSVSLSAFDADHGDHGLLEVAVQLTNPVQGLGLNLWYGKYPRRKRLPLITPPETSGGLASGVYVRYLRPEDAACPAYPASAKYQPDGGIDSNFVTYPDVCLNSPDGGGPWTCTDGKWGELDPTCAAFSYDDVPIYLTAESCTAHVVSSASILSIRYLDAVDGCDCQEDTQCLAGQTCHFEAKVAAPWCAATTPACGGICSGAGACGNVGAPCSVTVGGKTCMSQIVCNNGVPSCLLSQPCL